MTTESQKNAILRKIKEIRSQLAELEDGDDLPNLFRRMLDATDNVIVIADATLPDIPLIYVNKQFEILTGYTYDEVVGRNCRFLQGDDRDQPELERLRKAIKKGKNARVELRNYRKNGEMFWNELYLTAVHDRSGKLKYFLGVQNDITELKDLFESERDLRQVMGTFMAFAGMLSLEGEVLRVDQSTLNTAKLDLEDVLYEPLEETVWWSHSEEVKGQLREAIQSGRDGKTCRFDLKMRVKGDEGEEKFVTVDFCITPRFDSKGKLAQLIATGMDVTERKEAEEGLRRRTREFVTLVENTPDIIARFNKDLRYVYVNSAVVKATGLSANKIIGKRLEDFDDTGTHKIWNGALQEVFWSGQETELEVRFPSSHGEQIYTCHFVPEWSAAKSPEDEGESATAESEVDTVLVISRNVTAQKQTEVALKETQTELLRQINALRETEAELQRANERLYHDAFHDSLTGLPNRALFMDRLTQIIKHQRREPERTAAVLFLDFDRFKIVNDSLGHAAGDALLVSVGERLKTCVRPADTVARLGGDEFAILLEGIEEAQAVQVAQRIMDAFTDPVNVDEHSLHTSASIGVVASTGAYRSASDAMRDADIAMYRAKGESRGTYRVFNENMHRQVVATMSLEKELHRALEQGEFKVVYQPILATRSGALMGFEALLRWSHPQRGMVLPAEFLPLAEEMGLMVKLDRYVWRTACQQVKVWQEHLIAPLGLSLNLSSQHALYPDLTEELNGILCCTGFSASQLTLEITEGALIDASQGVRNTFKALKALGVKLHLDDFGTGYSSLSYLQRFPVDALKIDRSFIDNMQHLEESAELVRTIINMAQNLGLEVIAEGVETEAQLAQLRRLGCTYSQGFFFSKPLSEARVLPFIDHMRRALS